jgi:hypothetical protein
LDYRRYKIKNKRRAFKDQIKNRLLDIANEIKNWKESLTLIPSNTIFVFVADKEEPRAFKIYDTSSLGCSTTLTPPRWKIYQKGLSIE